MTPEDHGFKRAAPQAIKGGDANQNAVIIRSIFNGKKGPQQDVVLLNAAAAFVSAGLDADFKGGIQRARQTLDSGSAAEKLDKLIHFTRQCNFFVRRAM
jgi:anthranilate phosphoribosyltransferase